MNDINQIYKKDFKEALINTYKLLSNKEKSLNKIISQINKKLTKYDFYEQKNFTGMR